MPYLGQHLRVTWRFQIVGSEEIAETNLNFSSGAPWTGASAALAELTPAFGATATASMVDLCTDTLVRWADYSVLSSVKVAAIGTDGHQVPGSIPREFPNEGLIVGTAFDVLPQSSVVVSTRTVNDLGQGARGRMFIPHTVLFLVGGTPHASVPSTLAFATNAALFINEVRDAMNADLTDAVLPVIVGQTGVGTTRVITRVSVGDVNDTQRRRRNQLNEVYSTVSVP